MAVLFQPAQGQFLKPDRPAQLLQGFLNIQDAEGVQNGHLTKANLDSYAQKQFFAADPNSDVAAYLNQNYAQIAKLDGDASSISADDLVCLREDLPPPPPPGQPQEQDVLPLLMTIMQTLLLLITNLFQK